ncbi:hypothetical protein BV898_09991 [Hypsibius exemplaris]|uniref:Cytoplasmic dynein 2 light intermediate chain 1 n=1 Tax=Hypsibius exemplaris TaxID=2072580 RepID=A0A1W0WKZ7_HYPEX|nr:hypothetical protein BV898_09991 [Hypsibius exemplaris]
MEPSSDQTVAHTASSKVKRFAEYPDIWATASALLSGAVKAEDGIIKTAQQAVDRHLIVLGGKSAGKTTLITRYLERTVDEHDTIGISYSFLRKQRDDGSLTDVGNIWEIGSSSVTAEMLEIVSNPLDGSNVMIFILVDVSRPETLLSVMENVLFPLNGTIANFADASVWIIGTKFDRQQSLNFELDKRQAVLDILRQIATTLSFGLLYTSQQNNQDAKVKSILDNWFLGEKMPEFSVALDALKLIFLPLTLTGAKRQSVTKPDMERWKLLIGAAIPQTEAAEFRPVKEAPNDAKLYAETELDEAFKLIAAEIKAKRRSTLRP